MPHLDLRTALAVEPITFTISDGQTFTARADLPAVAVLAMKEAGSAITADSAVELLDQMLEPGSAIRFADAFRAGAVGIHEFVAIVRFIVQEATARPTPEPNGSSPPSPPTSPASTDGALPGA